MRPLAALCFLSMTACGPTLEFNNSQSMSQDDMLRRATLVFAGVIRRQTIDHSLTTYWKVLRRDVDVETIFRGEESSRRISVYEVFSTGGTSGDWNFTREGERALFLVFQDHDRYHVVRDWWRSIFPIASGPHRRLPMDESHQFWERFALMMAHGEVASRLAPPSKPTSPHRCLPRTAHLPRPGRMLRSAQASGTNPTPIRWLSLLFG